MSVSPHIPHKNRENEPSETMTNQNDETALTLPGLELQGDRGGPPSALRQAVITTLGALKSEGLLEDRHTALAQLALELADSVTAGRRSGRASAAAMAAAQLLAVLQALPEPLAADLKQKFDSFVEALVTGGDG